MSLVLRDHHGAWASAAGAEGSDMADKTPTVVLVHGAFADASSWNGVVELLQSNGVTVTLRLTTLVRSVLGWRPSRFRCSKSLGGAATGNGDTASTVSRPSSSLR
jgi:hypothetical protein